MSSAAAVSSHRAIQVHSFEGATNYAKNVSLVTKPVPVPKEDELLVRLKCRSVNPADGLSLMGLYPGFSRELPATPGLEGMGVVETVGSSVANFKVGDRVAPIFALACDAKEGSWQEYVCAKAAFTIALPEFISDDDGAQIVLNPLTALAMLRRVKAQKGDFIIQSQASSACGRMVIQLAKHLGIRSINIVRREGLEEELKALGADEVICCPSNKDDVAKLFPSILSRVRELTSGKMAHSGLDSVAGDITGLIVGCVRNGGEVLVYGGASGASFTASIVDLLFRDVSLHGFWFREYLKSLTPEEQQEMFQEMLRCFEQKIVQTHTGEKFDLALAAETAKLQQKIAGGGKLLLVG